MQRRIFLKGSLVSGFISLVASSALLLPAKLLAAWNKAAFQAKDMDSANAALGDTASAVESDRVHIDAKDIAENAAVVPIKISTDIENAESIRLYVEKNPTPLIATFKLTKYTDNFVFIRVKMRETSNIIAMVQTGEQLYMTKKAIKVTAGGCGG
ncbi:MAG: thiosulfate oxidation carrier protein SoxY [Gammaproteobacteria bacterium]|nr:thiosulfate oxidation carrier protein SoxY [Gammaproteobacteria bacterium]